MTTNTEPPADVKRLIQKAKFEVAALHNEGRPDLAQFIARMGEALLSAQPAPSQSGLVEVDVEETAWKWLAAYANRRWGECANDVPAYGCDEMIDAFMAGCDDKALRTNNQPAPDDGLAGWQSVETLEPESYVLFRFPEKSSKDTESPNVAVGKLCRDGDIWLTAQWAGSKAHVDPTGWMPLTAKDHTALRGAVASKLSAHRTAANLAYDNQSKFAGDLHEQANGIDIALKCIDQALATKGGGE